VSGSALTPVLAATPVSTVEEVLAVMHAIDGALDARDGISCFNRLYLAVTEGVLAAARQNQYRNAPFITTLDVAFANLYFAALRAFDAGAADVPHAWSPLFEARARTTIAPIQFALAGMNAHINRDLPVALVTAFTTLGMAGGDPVSHADYEKVNDLLATVEKQVKDGYLCLLAKQIDPGFHGVDDIVAMWSVRTARNGAWTNADALWHLRDVAGLRDKYLDGLDRMTGFAARGLLLPTAKALVVG
jgi:hypothetical protein